MLPWTSVNSETDVFKLRECFIVYVKFQILVYLKSYNKCKSLVSDYRGHFHFTHAFNHHILTAKCKSDVDLIL